MYFHCGLGLLVRRPLLDAMGVDTAQVREIETPYKALHSQRKPPHVRGELPFEFRRRLLPCDCHTMIRRAERQSGTGRAIDLQTGRHLLPALCLQCVQYHTKIVSMS